MPNPGLHEELKIDQGYLPLVPNDTDSLTWCISVFSKNMMPADVLSRRCLPPSHSVYPCSEARPQPRFQDKERELGYGILRPI